MCSAVLCRAVPGWAGLGCAVLCCAVLCCAVLCCAVLCSADAHVLLALVSLYAMQMLCSAQAIQGYGSDHNILQ